MIARFLASRTDRTRRTQSGYTLIEVLLVVGISAIIIGPLMAWTVLAMRTQPITRDGMIRSADTGLLSAYLPEDIAVAGAAAVPGSPVPVDDVVVGLDDCRGQGETDDDAVLALLTGGDPVIKTVYTEAPALVDGAPDPDRVSIWRRVCSAEDGLGTVATQVFTDVVSGSTVATCDAPTGDAPCRQIELRTQAFSGGNQIVLAGTRRADSESLRFAPSGNRLPVAKINLISQVAAGSGATVQLSATGSVDPGGANGAPGGIVSYRWSLPAQPEGSGVPPLPPVELGADGADQVQTLVLPSVGRYHVTLTVTDDEGEASTTYKRITVLPRAPTAVAQVSPTNGVASVDTFNFTGSGSTDPDGTIVRYRWVLGGEEGAGGVSYVVDQADWEIVFPAYVSGQIPVTLTVTDDQGQTDTAVTRITVNAPEAPDPGPEPVLDPEEPPVEPPPVTVPGGPTAVFVAAQDADPARWSFDAGGSTSPGTITTYNWSFGDGAAASGAATSHVFAQPGTYTVSLEVTDDNALSSSVTRSVNVPGAPAEPAAPTQQGSNLVWAPVPGARRYLVDFRFTGSGCDRTIVDQAVGASATPSKSIPPNLCTVAGATAEARYWVEANGQRADSAWVPVTPPEATGTVGPGTVVK